MEGIIMADKKTYKRVLLAYSGGILERGQA